MAASTRLARMASEGVPLLIGESEVDLDDEERADLVRELWLVQRPGGYADAAAEVLEQPGDRSPLTFSVPELGALHRALSNLDGAGSLGGRTGLQKLLEQVTAVVSPARVEYELVLELRGETRRLEWTSLSGPLEVGDRLCLPSGSWRVHSVEPHQHLRYKLFCEPFDPEDAILPPELTGRS
jgi:hypothetical protein